VSGCETGRRIRRYILCASRRTSAALAVARNDQAVRVAALAERQDCDRDSESGMPGDLRYALLLGPNAHAAGSSSAAGVLPGGIRHRKYRGEAARAGGGVDGVAAIAARRLSRRLLRWIGLRDHGDEAVDQITRSRADHLTIRTDGLTIHG